MLTEFQQAIADGVEAIAASQAGVWTFGALVFSASESDLKANDPRMAGAADRLIELRTVSAGLPAGNYPKRGSEISRGGETYRVHRADHFFSAGVSIFLVSRSSLPVFAAFGNYFTAFTSFTAYANAGGDTAIAAPASGYNTAEVTFSGAGSLRNLVLGAGLIPGAVLNLSLIFPAASGFDVRARNLTVGGVLLYDLSPDNSGADAALELVWSGTAWRPFKSTYPA